MEALFQDLRSLPRTTWAGQWVSGQAWQLYLAFKDNRLQQLDQTCGHVLLAADVRTWLADRR